MTQEKDESNEAVQGEESLVDPGQVPLAHQPLFPDEHDRHSDPSGPGPEVAPHTLVEHPPAQKRQGMKTAG